jgi:hypothetical protein
MRSDNPKNNKNVMESLKNNKNVATQRMSMYERQRNTLPHSDLLEIRVNRFIDHDSHKPQ